MIRIPGNLSQDNSSYRLDYSPPHGVPPPNTTIPSRDIGDVIQFSKGLPGTKYEFWLYYSNSSLHDWLTWTASITTGNQNRVYLSFSLSPLKAWITFMSLLNIVQHQKSFSRVHNSINSTEAECICALKYSINK